MRKFASWHLFLIIFVGALFFLLAALPLAIPVERILPPLAAPLFFGGLFAWFIPGLLLKWTGAFTFVEFGAKPNGFWGYAAAIIFWAAVSGLLAWLSARSKRTRPKTHPPPASYIDP